MFIVQISSGEYSSYSLEKVYVGENDPGPIVKKLVQKETEGQVDEWTALTNWVHSGMYKDSEFNRRQKILFNIRKLLEPWLVENGFREASEELTEYWIGP